MEAMSKLYVYTAHFLQKERNLKKPKKEEGGGV